MTNSGNCFMKFYTVPIHLSGKEMTSKRENECSQQTTKGDAELSLNGLYGERSNGKKMEL